MRVALPVGLQVLTLVPEQLGTGQHYFVIMHGHGNKLHQRCRMIVQAIQGGQAEGQPLAAACWDPWWLLVADTAKSTMLQGCLGTKPGGYHKLRQQCFDG